MRETNRRRMLKGLALSVPAAWTPPLVKSVILPAHAQTSGCDAPRGCYSVGGGTYFPWPGGIGPYKVSGQHSNASADCSNCTCDIPGGSLTIVAATSLEAGYLLLGCEEGYAPVPVETTPALPSGCMFYACLPNESP